MSRRVLTEAQESAAIEFAEALLDGCESRDRDTLAAVWRMFERENPIKAAKFSPVQVAA